MSGAAEVNPITVDVYLDITVENISTLKDLTVKFDNYDEDLHYVKEVTDNSVKVDGIIPGIYSVTVSGTAIDTENNEYYINGNSVNAALFKHGSALNIEVQGLKVSPLIFKEIYYCGSRPKKGESISATSSMRYTITLLTFVFGRYLFRKFNSGYSYH